jgi:hypothetical protein
LDGVKKMAKIILWFLVIVGIISHVQAYYSGDDVGVFTKAFVLSALGVLALCEAIEKK